MKKIYIVHITNRVHSLVQIPYYECAFTTKEKAVECFNAEKADFMKNREHPDWWVTDIDDAEEFEANISDFRDWWHLYIYETETDEEFVEGEWTRGDLGEEEDEADCADYNEAVANGEPWPPKAEEKVYDDMPF